MLSFLLYLQISCKYFQMINNEILKKSNLSVTSHRIGLLRILKEARFPLSEREIEKLLDQECNKTTIYRNLNKLVEKGIVHRIVADSAVKYKYVDFLNNYNGFNEHVHFQCDQCQQIMCLNDVPVQPYALPEGYTGKENQFMIVGVCSECNFKYGKEK